jgi:hypothetical protein
VDGQGDQPERRDNGGEGGPDGRPDPAELLGDLGTLRRRARAARHGYWFPLVLFGLLTCVSAPFYVGQDDLAATGPGSTGPVAVAGSTGPPPLPFLGGYAPVSGQRFLGYYWLAALLGGLLLTLLWYRWHGRRAGVATPARGYIASTAVLTALAVALPLLARLNSAHWLRPLAGLWPGDLVMRGTFPFVIIAFGLWVLAWAERSRALALIAALYTGSALLSSLYDTENILFRLGWSPSSAAQWSLTSLPNVLLPALVLLAAGAAAFAVQRQRRPAMP